MNKLPKDIVKYLKGKEILDIKYKFSVIGLDRHMITNEIILKDGTIMMFDGKDDHAIISHIQTGKDKIYTSMEPCPEDTTVCPVCGHFAVWDVGSGHIRCHGRYSCGYVPKEEEERNEFTGYE